MAKKKRIIKGGLVYHVLNRANGKLRIFRKDQDFIAFETVLAEGIERFDMRICGYCIMSNHWHMLLWPGDDDSLAAFMHWITVTHTKRWHASHGTTGIGHLYQGRYKSFPVQVNQRYFKALSYIEANPLRAEIVTDACDWKWSSLTRRSDPSRPFPICPGPISVPPDWARWVNRPQSQVDSVDFTNCIKRGTPYGEHDWKVKTAKLLQLETTLTKRGRPRKYPENIP